MTYAEFRQWAWECLSYRIRPDGSGSASRVPWLNGSLSYGKPGTGYGHAAVYGPLQQRRLAVWLRARRLINPEHIGEWIKAGETRDTGWLINCGDGIWWTEDPSIVAHDLAQTGFIAIRCGVEG